ncbi:MAG TPA: hypothetical protein PLE80_04865 [Opitutaceae bacterium]|nr:hypothetical protein [Opitutaceae bacterium]
MPLTLLDIAKRSGSDEVVGLIEEVLTVAPEFRTIPVRPITGTSYKATFRTGLPGSGFRGANEGVTPGNSVYDQKSVDCYFLDCQMQVDEAIVKADEGRIGDILTDEGIAALQSSFITVGKQVYDGISADSKGFTGLFANVDSNMVVNAGGSGDATHTAWAIYENERDGVHFPLGNGGALELGEWIRQQVKDANNKSFMAWVNNLSAWIGLNLTTKYSIGCVKNITSGKPLTDALGNELVSKFPVGRKPTHWFMSRDAKFYLQRSRSATLGQKDSGRGDAFAAIPTALADVPIVETDSIDTRTAA